jgi:predicted DCC family thiol-disulfide oxidoreductase YuxK
MKAPELTLFYDGNCPFCLTEMTRLRSWNHADKLGFVDINATGFDPQILGVTMKDLDSQLHSLRRDGCVLVGIDSMLLAYTLVNKAWLVLPLRVKFLRPAMSYLYRKFARNRYKFSALFGYKKTVRCEEGVCRLEHPFLGQSESK